MFNQKITRTQVTVIAVAAMLVLAGCSTGSNPGIGASVESQEPTTVTVVSEESSETIDPEYGPEDGQNLTEYSNDLGSDAAGLSRSERKQVEDLVVGFYDDLPENKSERRDLFLDTADEHCAFEEEYSSRVNTSALEENGSDLGDTVRRAHYGAQIVNEFDSQVPVEPFGDVRSDIGDVTKYAPLLGSYNQMSDKACAASEDRTDAAIQEYQFATLMFGVDAMLISTGAFYQPAFAGTRFTVNKASQLGLYRLRYVCGDRCWALAMSEVHVTLRGSMVSGTSNVLRQAGEMGTELSREDLEAVADEYNTDVDKMLENVDSSTTSDALESVADDTSKCRDAVLESGDGGSSGDGDGLFGGGGIDKDDIVEKGEEALNKSGQAVEDCRDAGG